MTKQRIADLEDSKNSLSQQVQRLKDQLEKFESSQFTSVASQHQHQQQPMNMISKELEILREQINKNKAMETASEVVQTIEKYKKEIDHLNDTNQNLKLSLKEKDLEDKELKIELKCLKDKNFELDKENQSLRSDLDLTLQKLNELAFETNQNVNQLNTFEEQLNFSEKSEMSSNTTLKRPSNCKTHFK